MFGREDTIIAYASLKAAVTILTIQYANAFRRSGIHAHIKINAATPWVIAADLNNQPGNRIVEHGSQIIVQLRYFASRRTKRGILQRCWYRGMVSKSFADASVISPGRLG